MVTACMPVWNAECFVEPVLRSLAVQTYRNLQVLISDDASSDGSPAICEAFASGRPGWRIQRQEVNLGWIANVNWLMREADGEYLFFAFHDDPLEPTYVERLVEALERVPDAPLAFTDIILEEELSDGSKSVTVSSFDALDRAGTRLSRLRVFQAMTYHWFIPNRGLFRKSAARQVGFMRRNLAGEFCADLPWLIGLSLLGPFVRVPEPLIRKNWRAKGLSRSWRWTFAKRVALLLACLATILRSPLGALERTWLVAQFCGFWTLRVLQKAFGDGRRTDSGAHVQPVEVVMDRSAATLAAGEQA